MRLYGRTVATRMAAKRKPARPAKPSDGKTPIFAVRLDAELRAELKAWAEANHVTESSAIRLLLTRALRAEKTSS